MTQWLYKDFCILYKATMLAFTVLRQEIIDGKAERKREYDDVIRQLERLAEADSICRIEAVAHPHGDHEAVRDQELRNLHEAGLDATREIVRLERRIRELETFTESEWRARCAAAEAEAKACKRLLWHAMQGNAVAVELSVAVEPGGDG